jgi:hypothetical protein
MRPIPWILVSLVLTAVGIVMTYEGQTTIRPERRIPSRWPGQRSVDVDALVAGMPGYHDQGAGESDTPEPEPEKPRTPLLEFAVPEGHGLPVSPIARKIVPSMRTPLVVVQKGAGLAVTSPAVMEGEGVTTKESAHSLKGYLAKLVSPEGADEPVEIEPVIVVDGRITWARVGPILEAAAGAGCKRVHLGALRSAKGLVVCGLAFILPVGEPRGTMLDDGGVLEVRTTADGVRFGFREHTSVRARDLTEAIREWHRIVLELEDVDYADKRAAWAVKVGERTPYASLVDAFTALRMAGFKWVGIEAE